MPKQIDKDFFIAVKNELHYSHSRYAMFCWILAPGKPPYGHQFSIGLTRHPEQFVYFNVTIQNDHYAFEPSKLPSWSKTGHPAHYCAQPFTVPASASVEQVAKHISAAISRATKALQENTRS